MNAMSIIVKKLIGVVSLIPQANYIFKYVCI